MSAPTRSAHKDVLSVIHTLNNVFSIALGELERPTPSLSRLKTITLRGVEAVRELATLQQHPKSRRKVNKK